MPKAKAANKKARKSASRKRSAGYRVFVSHATSDKWLATILCEKIEAVGASTFRDDRDIKGGDDIPDEIRKSLIESRELVMLLTPDSVDRPWVLLEAGAFWGRRHNSRIIAVMCHITAESIPDMIKTKKAISLNEFDAYLRDLSKRVQGAK